MPEAPAYQNADGAEIVPIIILITHASNITIPGLLLSLIAKCMGEIEIIEVYIGLECVEKITLYVLDKNTNMNEQLE